MVHIDYVQFPHLTNYLYFSSLPQDCLQPLVLLREASPLPHQPLEAGRVAARWCLAAEAVALVIVIVVVAAWDLLTLLTQGPRLLKVKKDCSYNQDTASVSWMLTIQSNVLFLTSLFNLFCFHKLLVFPSPGLEDVGVWSWILISCHSWLLGWVVLKLAHWPEAGAWGFCFTMATTVVTGLCIECDALYVEERERVDYSIIRTFNNRQPSKYIHGLCNRTCSQKSHLRSVHVLVAVSATELVIEMLRVILRV